MYACAAGHEDIVRELLKHGARVEDNNENGHTPLMEAASAGHVGVAKVSIYLFIFSVLQFEHNFAQFTNVPFFVHRFFWSMEQGSIRIPMNSKNLR